MSVFCEHAAESTKGEVLEELSNFWTKVFCAITERKDDLSAPPAYDPNNSLGKSSGAPTTFDIDRGISAIFRDRNAITCLTCGREVQETKVANPSNRSSNCRLSCAICLSEGRVLAVNNSLLHLYCCVCDQIVFDPEFDAARCHAFLTAKWFTEQPIASIDQYALEPGVGLRGMCNLGNTCYMNAVLQVLSQQVPIRDYYLSTGHQQVCKIAAAVRGNESCSRHQKKLRDMVERSLSLFRSKTGLKLQQQKKSPRQQQQGMSQSRKRKGPGLLEAWDTERDSAFFTRYAFLWQRPWCPADFTFPINGPFASLTDTVKGRQEYLHGASHVAHTASSDVKTENGCIACELEILIKDLYTGTNARQPLVLNHFLYSTWQNSSLLSGYMQQDAHEFFSFVVNSAHSADEFGQPQNQCNCIMHQTFGGMLCSQITCGWCGAVSESYEPFFDVSLDLPSEVSLPHNHQQNLSATHEEERSAEAPNEGLEPSENGISSENNEIGSEPPEKRRREDENDDQVSTKSKSDRKSSRSSHSRSPRRNLLTRGLSFNAPPVSLESLIEKFVSVETLAAEVRCEHCNQMRENFAKQLRFQQLPPIICFHIKRFRAGTSPHNAQKSDQAVSFPLRGLNLSDFCMDAKPGTEQPSSPILYDLCGVIQHTGNMDSGHYFCFVLHHGAWYRCDDVFIRRVFEVEVLEAQGYMLFYKCRDEGTI